MASAAAARDKGRSATSPTDIPSQGWIEIARRTWSQVGKDNVGIVAAGVGFYFFLALVPLLGATVLTYGLFTTPEAVVRQAQGLTAFLPGEAARLIGEQMLNVVETSGEKKGFGLLLAIAVAFWGARNAAGAIVTALNIAYAADQKRGIVKSTLLALAMTLGAIIMVGVVGVAIAILAAVERLLPDAGPVGRFLFSAVTYAMLGAMAAAAAATLYRYGPSRKRARWTWLTPGSLFFAVVWLLLTLGFGFYVRNFASYGATYGALSSVVVLLTWLYLSSYVLIFGAELNSEVEHQTARDTFAKPGEQSPGARGALGADHVVQQENEERPPVDARPIEVVAPQREDDRGHSYLASRLASRTGQLAGARRISMLSSGLATLGLGFLKKRGSEKAGALLLVTAAGLALLNRR